MFLVTDKNINVAKWLYSSNDIKIYKNSDYIFKNVCAKKQLIIAQWLCTLTYRYIIINEETYEYIIIKPNTNLIKKLEKSEKYITDVNIDEICVICYEQQNYMCKLECKHIYCCACLKQYLELEYTTCCYCRKEIDETSDCNLIYKKNL